MLQTAFFFNKNITGVRLNCNIFLASLPMKYFHKKLIMRTIRESHADVIFLLCLLKLGKNTELQAIEDGY